MQLRFCELIIKTLSLFVVLLSLLLSKFNMNKIDYIGGMNFANPFDCLINMHTLTRNRE
jgi:hypothetical protein